MRLVLLAVAAQAVREHAPGPQVEQGLELREALGHAPLVLARFPAGPAVVDDRLDQPLGHGDRGEHHEARDEVAGAEEPERVARPVDGVHQLERREHDPQGPEDRHGHQVGREHRGAAVLVLHPYFFRNRFPNAEGPAG